MRNVTALENANFGSRKSRFKLYDFDPNCCTQKLTSQNSIMKHMNRQHIFFAKNLSSKDNILAMISYGEMILLLLLAVNRNEL